MSNVASVTDGQVQNTSTTSANKSNSATVTDGKVENTSITSTKTSNVGSTSLGKDAFLQLLVAQMQYQDPLEPSSDTEWIAQLAQFSSLEEMQNMSSTMTNTQALTMVGKTVEIVSDNKTIQGVVDYVTMSGNKTYVSVNGTSYKASEVTAVLGDAYLQSTNGPQVATQTATFDFDEPSSVKFAVSLGKDEYAATGMYVAIDNDLVDSKYLTYDDENKILEIKQEALMDLIPGKSYSMTFIFDDAAQTNISGKATLKVIGNKPAAETEDTETTETPAESEDTTSGTATA